MTQASDFTVTVNAPLTDDQLAALLQQIAERIHNVEHLDVDVAGGLTEVADGDQTKWQPNGTGTITIRVRGGAVYRPMFGKPTTCRP